MISVVLRQERGWYEVNMEETSGGVFYYIVKWLS